MKDKIVFDPSEFADSDKIGSYLVDSNGDLLTSTLVGADQALDINVVQSVLPTGAATEATLADILADTANIDTNIAAILADTANIDTNIAAILVDTGEIQTAVEAINSDTTAILADTANIDSVLSALSKAEDSVHVSGDQGIMSLAVRNDAGTPLAADGDYIPLSTDENGALRVSAEVSVEAGDAEYLEDSAHSSGDAGLFTLAVRNDAGTSLVDTDGDYAPLQVDESGALRISGAVENAAPNTAILSQAISVDDTAGGTELPTSPLAARKVIWVQNNDSKSVAIGPSGVTYASGFILSPGSVAKIDLGPGVDLYAIADAGKTADIRVMEQS